MGPYTFTLNGKLGETTSSFARQAIGAPIDLASMECATKIHRSFSIRKNALDGTPNTVLPLVIPLGLSNCYFLFVQSVNPVTLSLSAGEIQTVKLGNDAHPEGMICMFGVYGLTTITITQVEFDETQVEIVAGGSL